MKLGNPERALPEGRGRRVGVVASRFHGPLVERLIDGAAGLLVRSGVDSAAIRTERVAGAWEIPQGLDLMARHGAVDGLIALGVLIRGETLHFEIIARECARGIAEVGRKHGLPVTFGVLTCETMAQAEARSGGAAGNLGEDAAVALLELLELAGRLRTG